MFPNAQYDVKILSDIELYHKVKTYIKDKRTKRIVHTLLTPTQIRYVKIIMKSRRLPNFLSSFLETNAGRVELTGSFKWGYWVTEESKEFEKYIHKLITGKDKISDLDIVIHDPIFPIDILSNLPIEVEIKPNAESAHKKLFDE